DAACTAGADGGGAAPAGSRRSVAERGLGGIAAGHRDVGHRTPAGVEAEAAGRGGGPLPRAGGAGAMNKITVARVSGYDAAITRASNADVHVIGAEGELDEHAVTALGDEIVGLARSEEHTSELQSRENLVC